MHFPDGEMSYVRSGENSRGVFGCFHASQSLLSVGNRPILQHLYSPSAIHASWQTTNVSFCAASECCDEFSRWNG